MNFMACFVRIDIFYFYMPGGMVPHQSRCEVTTCTPSSDASCRPAIQLLSYTQCICEVNAAIVAKGTEVEPRTTATIKLHVFCVRPIHLHVFTTASQNRFFALAEDGCAVALTTSQGHCPIQQPPKSLLKR